MPMCRDGNEHARPRAGKNSGEVPLPMELNGKEILVCDCEGTMDVDGKALAKACGAKDLTVNRP